VVKTANPPPPMRDAADEQAPEQPEADDPEEDDGQLIKSLLELVGQQESSTSDTDKANTETLHEANQKGAADGEKERPPKSRCTAGAEPQNGMSHAVHATRAAASFSTAMACWMLLGRGMHGLAAGPAAIQPRPALTTTNPGGLLALQAAGRRLIQGCSN
jgi:hypothetical protein